MLAADGPMLLLLRGTVVVLLLLAAVCDMRSRRIPNRLVAAVALLGLAVAASGGLAALPTALVTALTVLLLTFAAFAAGVLGGGDAKLVAAVALVCATPAAAVQFLMLTVMAGGVLALFWLFWRRRPGVDPRLPYGVAIAAGGIPALLPKALHALF